MHELSMVYSILDAVIDSAEKNNAIEVLEVGIEIGKLAMLNPEQVLFLLDTLKEDTIAKNAKFIIEEIDVEVICPSCGYEGVVHAEGEDHYAPIYKCPKCEEYKVEITAGKECYVKNIKIEQED